MLPLIPALILLLLQGPTATERLAQAGRMTDGLDAVQRRMVRTHETRALASLIEASNDPQLSEALLRMLLVPVGAESKGPEVNLEDATTVVSVETAAPRLLEGFVRSQRTRDGPYTA